MGGHETDSSVSVEADAVFQFFPDADLVSIRSLGEGNINDTYLVVSRSHPTVVLQKINGEVFPDPEGVAENGWLVSEHLRGKRACREKNSRLLSFIPTREGRRYYLDRDGDVWRMQYFLENTVTCNPATISSSAYEGGKLLGGFHSDLADFSSEQLKNPLPGFHDLPGYCVSYVAARKGFCGDMTDELALCMQEVEKRLDEASILEHACKKGTIRKRVIHGDPKSANMLLDRDSGRGVAMIDLDTVARGLLMHDLGDCLRSFCNPAGEVAERIENVVFDIARCEEVLRGYADSGARLSTAEQGLVYQGARLMTYELSVRFLTDFLEGNRYFKVRHRFENLQRAKIQVQLLKSIEKQRRILEQLVFRVFVSG